MTAGMRRMQDLGENGLRAPLPDRRVPLHPAAVDRSDNRPMPPLSKYRQGMACLALGLPL